MSSPSATPARWYELQLYRASVPESVVSRTIADETVLLNIETGQYHTTNAVGGRFLDALRDAPTLTAAATALSSEFGQPVEVIRTDLLEFIGALTTRSLITLAAPA